MKASPEIAVCNHLPSDQTERTRQEDRCRSLKTATHTVNELDDGYEFVFKPTADVIKTVGELFYEHACCPLLNLELFINPKDTVMLRLRGSAAAKTKLKYELHL